MTKKTEILDTVLPGRYGSCSNREWRPCCAVVMRCALTLLVAASFARPAQAASPAAEASARLLAQVEPRIKAIYETNEYAIRSFGATWLPDGSGYLRLETPAGPSGAEIASYDSASGEHGSDHWLYEPASGALRPVDAGTWFDANAFSPDGQRLLGSRGADLIVLTLPAAGPSR